MSDVYSFHDLARDFETQGIDVYDVFSGKNHFNEWCDAKGLGEVDPDGNFRGSSQTWYSDYINCPEGSIKRPPPANLCHWFINNLSTGKRLSKGASGLFVDVVVTQEIIDRTAWVSAIMSPMLAISGGNLKLRLFFS